MTTASTRIWTFATVFVIIIVIALGWFVGISPKLADAARFDADRQAVVIQNDAAYDNAIEEMLNGMLASGLTLQNVAINESALTTAAVLVEGAAAPAPEMTILTS